MFDLDHFLDENNWTLANWGKDSGIFYQFYYQKNEDGVIKITASRIFLTTSNNFNSLLFKDLFFKNEFLSKTKEINAFYLCDRPLEYNFPSATTATKALKKKLKQIIQERSQIFTKEDMPCLN